MVNRIVTFKLSLAAGARDRMVPFIINSTKEMNFSSKVFSKSLLKVGSLKGSPCLLPIISRKLSPFLHQILVNMRSFLICQTPIETNDFPNAAC